MEERAECLRRKESKVEDWRRSSEDIQELDRLRPTVVERLQLGAKGQGWTGHSTRRLLELFHLHAGPTPISRSSPDRISRSNDSSCGTPDHSTQALKFNCQAAMSVQTFRVSKSQRRGYLPTRHLCGGKKSFPAQFQENNQTNIDWIAFLLNPT
ncbi:hypothetical protein BDV11DRAFT_96307 [Aspergillus similis]